MNLATTLTWLVDRMIDNPTEERTPGITALIIEFGFDVANVETFFSELNTHIVSSGRVPAPGGWDAIRDTVVALGREAAHEWCREFVNTSSFQKRPGVILVVLKEQRRLFGPQISHQQDLLDAADVMLSETVDVDEIAVIQLGRGVAQGAKAQLERQAAILDQQIAALS